MRAGWLLVLFLALALPAHAQTAGAAPQVEETEPAAPCGTRPVSIARFQWPSAALLAEIHALLLADAYGCQTQVLGGEMASAISAMAGSGQPAISPELWAMRIAETWNTGINNQALRSAADTYAEASLEGWYVPAYVAELDAELSSAADLAGSPVFGEQGESDATESNVEETETALTPGDLPAFISCPADWACSIINRNLLAAHGLAARFRLLEPANRFEMDEMIAGAVSRQEPFVTYYWAPNAILDQFDFVPLDMGSYDEEAMDCLADADCIAPQPSSFAPEIVVVAAAEWVFAELPEIAGYLRRASMPVSVMNGLLGELNLPGATVTQVAERFVEEQPEVWQPWVGEPDSQ
ncbi:ABC transporter substrate-binding protein [Devosia pacifica]|uniref:ABC transporter substrate-binding protein n=1 Tax=Devosia pacifica TaxID=1335967 RepID=A0A918S6X6_9HYPH|nr:glycine betaine ABC transporter substrate-binding protein [Devosia pacifica]GHA25829.1 ABC transporter substrate-binding protein [Devosia pacifica]